MSFGSAEAARSPSCGESGCGKTTTARMILQLVTPDRGELLFEGRFASIRRDKAVARRYREKVQAVFSGSLERAQSRA